MTTSPIDVRDPVATFRAFAEDAAWWGARRSHLAMLRNGFEKWLATEWLLWMRTVPFTGLPDGRKYDRVGLEAKAALSPDREYGDRKLKKQVDIWWALEDPDVGPWNFVELKVVFNNDNAEKMFRSAGWDLWYLSRLVADENANAVAVIVVGHGFADEADWKSRLVTVARESDDVAQPGVGGKIGDLRWQSWAKSLR